MKIFIGNLLNYLDLGLPTNSVIIPRIFFIWTFLFKTKIYSFYYSRIEPTNIFRILTRNWPSSVIRIVETSKLKDFPLFCLKIFY